MVGAAIGSSIGRHTGLGEDQVRSLVAAGAGAGIGATFNAPIAGMLFAMEVILGNFAIRHLNAVVIASVTAAVTARTLVGEERILSAVPHQVGDPRELLLKEVHWPAGCTLQAIRRVRAVLVPEGNTELASGDIVTGFGIPGARSQVMQRLLATSSDDSAGSPQEATGVTDTI